MDKILLITGGAGFIGSNFVHYWIQKYPSDKIIVLDSISYAANFNSIKSIIDLGKINFFKGNINNPELVINILSKFKVSHIINFAAESNKKIDF